MRKRPSKPLPRRKPRGSNLRPILSVIVPARNESRTIGGVVRNARAIMRRTEVIVVVNGSSDLTARVAQRAGARIVRYSEPVGHDVGRSIGARHARGRVLLFVDADFVLPVSTLRSYVRAVLRGQDIVLNSYSGFADAKRMHSTSEAKRLINRIIGRGDLMGSSMTAVPHAMSKRAAYIIGLSELSVPPKAQAKAIINGLSVTRAPLVEVSRLNRRRFGRIGTASVERLILGDHAEAIHYLTEVKGHRAGLTDLWRNRSLLDFYPKTDNLPPVEGLDPRLSVIIVAQNEEETIHDVLMTAKALVPEEIIVVVNGSTDRTADIVNGHGVKQVHFSEPLGHDVGRAVGALHAVGEVLLFLDGDIVFEPEELWPFVASCRTGADIALNNVNSFFQTVRMVDYVSMAKQFVNRVVCTPHLGFASMTAVPHALRREAIERIGYRHLAVPPLAHAIAAVNGLNMQLVPGVDVFRTNRKRKVNSKDSNLVEKLILGDHVEAIQWLYQHFGPRVFFPDVLRRRDLC
ncbi:glycosyltransferase family 2 protein [Paenibacillus alkalitolerans]|uniref:glycosyltransferase family 2 protein n=1 Tax=Paenibacillus alkalitolerans TaxID=2799335 RepID=UPI0018F515AA|nr:glycosyltransferase [Paenibacillus alkalitolerans]